MYWLTFSALKHLTGCCVGGIASDGRDDTETLCCVARIVLCCVALRGVRIWGRECVALYGADRFTVAT